MTLEAVLKTLGPPQERNAFDNGNVTLTYPADKGAATHHLSFDAKDGQLIAIYTMVY
jgi:hypothetical protein